MKPKTLKDFGEKKCEDASWNCERISPEDLKQEAIKWVKQIRLMRKEFPKQTTKETNLEEGIKWFFNITEEDLK